MKLKFYIISILQILVNFELTFTGCYNFMQMPIHSAAEFVLPLTHLLEKHMFYPVVCLSILAANICVTIHTSIPN